MNQLYRMFEPNPRGMIPVTLADARRFNAERWGIFWAVQEFKSTRRTIENLRRIRGWAVDLDSGTKSDQKARLESSPLVPSTVIGTRRGLHAYWCASGSPSAESYPAVMQTLTERFRGDQNATDLARVLRVPGYLQWKDPNHPYLIQTLFESGAVYSEQQMVRFFDVKPIAPPLVHEGEVTQQCTGSCDTVTGGDIWERIYNLDCAEGLARLSGTSAVGGETFKLQPTSKGKRNILVDGKGTSTWIDSTGRIGSLDRGGPTLLQWLEWYGHSKGAAVRVLKEVFPQLEGTD